MRQPLNSDAPRSTVSPRSEKSKNSRIILWHRELTEPTLLIALRRSELYRDLKRRVVNITGYSVHKIGCSLCQGKHDVKDPALRKAFMTVINAIEEEIGSGSTLEDCSIALLRFQEYLTLPLIAEGFAIHGELAPQEVFSQEVDRIEALFGAATLTPSPSVNEELPDEDKKQIARKHALQKVEAYIGIYSRIARELNFDASHVRRVLLGIRKSDPIMNAIFAELKRIDSISVAAPALPPVAILPGQSPEKEQWPRHCDLCNTDMTSPDGRTEWHGLGICVPVCDTCQGQGIQPEKPTGTPRVMMMPAPETRWRKIWKSFLDLFRRTSL
jgi:hypothetical protein